MKKLTSLFLAGAMMCSLAVTSIADSTNKLVTFDIWNANSDQPSMGNISTDNNERVLYNAQENTLQFATNPVNVSGYQSGIVEVLYDESGNGDYTPATTLSTGTVETGTKNDGINHTVTYLSSFEIDIPDYITKTGVEYIPIKMSVPHTPMDVVVGTGYLDARFRINWDDVIDTDISAIVPNTQMSSGSVSAVNLSDKGIQIVADTTMLATDVIMTTTAITSGEQYDFAKSVLGADVTNFELFEVCITLSGNEVTPTGSIEIIFPYSELSALYRINDVGTKTTLRGTASDDGYSILSRNLGVFAVVDGVKVAQGTSDFSDTSGHWAETSITNAVSAGLFNGTSATTFSPEAQMTNGMVITVLHRIAGTPSTSNDGATWYSEAMAWGYENGIIGTYTDFDASANATREGLATMLYYYETLMGNPISGADLSAFTDSGDISDWALDGLAWANAAGIVNGTTETSISPTAEATRAQVATLFWRYISE